MVSEINVLMSKQEKFKKESTKMLEKSRLCITNDNISTYSES